MTAVKTCCTKLFRQKLGGTRPHRSSSLLYLAWPWSHILHVWFVSRKIPASENKLDCFVTTFGLFQQTSLCIKDPKWSNIICPTLFVHVATLKWHFLERVVSKLAGLGGTFGIYLPKRCKTCETTWRQHFCCLNPQIFQAKHLPLVSICVSFVGERTDRIEDLWLV